MYIKKNQKLIIQIVDQYPSYLILKRSLKNTRTKGYLIFYQQANMLVAIWFSTKMVNCSCSANLTESIRQTLDEGSFGCGIFLGLQKTFDTVDHKFLLQKLEYYGIRGILMTGSSLTCQIVNNLSLSTDTIIV